jgi:hypothetical protein
VATFHPSDPAYESRVRASFARQGHMHTLSASLESVASGLVEIALTPGSAVLKTGVGRSEFHGLRLLEISYDEGERPSHGARRDYQDHHRQEQQTQQTE